MESSQGKDFISKIDATETNENSRQLSFFEKEKQPISPKFEMLPVGSIKPKGWLYEIMTEDITTGFVAHLDKLAPKVMQADDLYNTDRRNSLDDRPSAGNQVLTGADWEISMQWWNSESLGNWWDGFVRNAFLTEDENAMNRSQEIVNYLLASQDEDGYIGIYGDSMRYQHKGSNGELWSKTTAFRTLLAYYEFTGEERVLDAVIKSMDNLLTHYNEVVKRPFDLEKEYGGVTHGLMMTDVCETLYRITGDKKYSDYAVFLYRDFSENTVNRAFNDGAFDHLTDRDSLFESHSVHTYEQLRSVIQTYFATGFSEMEEVYENALHKLSHCILPSGAGFGNEWLSKQKAHPTTTAAEVCGIVELSHFYASAIQKTGETHFGDELEKMTFNALLGSRNEDGTGITYCKTDNCSALNRKAPQHNFEETDLRYKYSPAHTDVAVCCNPNYGRHFPYYVSSMWMKAEDGLAVVLYGASELKTTFNETEISIEQITNYPYSDEIEFKITASKPTDFALYFRKPNWVKSMSVKTENATPVFENGFYKIQKEWQSGDVIRLSFENEILTETHGDDEVYFQRGALIFAKEIPHKTSNIKDYELKGFHDYDCLPTDNNLENVTPVETLNFNASTQSITAKTQNTKSGKVEDLTLIPMGKTILRQVTFPKSKK